MSYGGGVLPEKTLLILVFGILVWFYPPSCWSLCLRALDLRGMQASQISTYMYGNVPLSADRALDGDLRTFVGYLSCSITEASSHPWWKVDLGTNHLLGRITLVNRGDCCPYRLAGATVRAGTDSNIFQNAACGLPVTSDQASIFGAHIQFVCDPPVAARYVSVDDKLHHWYAAAHDNTITLCEVIVEAYPLEDCLQTTTLDLKGMQASQISDAVHLEVALTADLAIDGDARTNADLFSCSITGASSHPWWKVDLGANHCLGRITLVNRGDCCQDQLYGAIVRAGTDSDISNNAACGLPVTLDQTSVLVAHITAVCVPALTARYVSVDNPRDAVKPLALCEVMVEEFPMEDCPQTTTIGISTAAIIVDPSFSITCMATLIFEGKRVTNQRPLLVVHTKSPMQCFLSCKMSNECRSFDYVMTSGQCRLYDVKAGDLMTDDQPGCMVYAVVRG